MLEGRLELGEPARTLQPRTSTLQIYYNNINLSPLSDPDGTQPNWLRHKRSQDRAARMRLIPLTVEAAIAGLVRTATTTLATVAPELEKTDDGPAIVARAKFEVECVRITLGQLQQLPIDNLSAIPLHQRAQVQLVHLVALLGEGVSALDSLGYILDDSYHTEADDADAGKRPDELIDAVWRLQDFRTSTWLLLNVLQRSV